MLSEYDLSEYIASVLTPQGTMSLEKLAAMQHEGSWADVASKAKRLVQSNQVTILRNAPGHVMAHVIGDHGEYDLEISRHDPNSSIIEQWNCECPWAQFAFDRTRKWKHLEGRVCSHVLAAYWKAKSTPLDIEGEDEGYQVPRGQMKSPVGPGQQKLFTPEQEMPRDVAPKWQPGQPTEEQIQEQGEQPAVQPPEQAPKTPPGGTPLVTGPQPGMPFAPTRPPSTPLVPQYDQLHLFDITAPVGGQPVPMATPVSVPGGRPPTPANPVVFPGTFSHFIPMIVVHSNFIWSTTNELEEYFEMQRSVKQPMYVQLTHDVTLELSGGKIPVPGAQPYDYSAEGVPLYRVVDLGYNPATQKRENANVNALSGAPEQTGTFAAAKGGRRGEVLDYDPTLRMAYVIIPLNYEGQDVRLHPHALKGWVDFSDIRPVSGAGNPFRRK